MIEDTIMPLVVFLLALYGAGCLAFHVVKAIVNAALTEKPKSESRNQPKCCKYCKVTPPGKE